MCAHNPSFSFSLPATKSSSLNLLYELEMLSPDVLTRALRHERGETPNCDIRTPDRDQSSGSPLSGTHYLGHLQVSRPEKHTHRRCPVSLFLLLSPFSLALFTIASTHSHANTGSLSGGTPQTWYGPWVGNTAISGGKE